jgi:hypothetical protein
VFNGNLELKGVDFEVIRMGWNLYEKGKTMNNEVQVVVLGWTIQIILTKIRCGSWREGKLPLCTM